MKTKSSIIAKKTLLNITLAGLVLSSISVITQASERVMVDKPAYTIKVLSENNARTGKLVNNVNITSSTKRSIHLKDGGVIWVSKDPASLTPILNITSNSKVEMKNAKLTSPISFAIKTNYASFISDWELNIYDTNDEDQLNPLLTFAGKDLSNGRTIKWDGKTKTGKTLQSGDQVSYVLTVKDNNGHIDKTRPHQISFVGAERFVDIKKTAENYNIENDLALQTIPVHGSRVRIFGRDIKSGNRIRINDESITLRNGAFVVEKLLPEGQHKFDIAITDNANQTFHKPLNVDLKSKYMFMVALADITIGKGKVTGNLETLSDGDKHLDGDIFVDGRLAFYLKGKIKGKYLITAQMDTGTEAIEDLFDNIHKKDPQSLFRRLDPDKYYPVYGDDSTLIDDTNSQGKIYVRVDWDKSRALWGNYNTDFTGTELSSFNRTLYGAKINHKSPEITKDGEHKTDVSAFASETQTAFRHNQFLGTGGSLYYLKDTDVVDGSEKVWIEIRQRESDRAVKKIIMQEGRDYEIDDFQGRILLHRPLLQIAEQSGPSLVKDSPLDGNRVFLMVDYEYVPSNFKADKASYGTRGKAWLNDNIAVGATYAHENRDQNDYDLKGVDLTFKKGNGTYIKGEYAKSESVQTNGSFLSEDGGLNFSAFNDNSAAKDIDGTAYSIEARANLKELTNKEGSIGAWHKSRDAGFSSSNYNNGAKTTDSGIEANIEASDKLKVSVKATLLNKEDIKETTTASVQGDYKLNEKISLGTELRHIKEDDKNNNDQDGKGTLAAFKVGYDLNQDVNLYAIAQATLSKSGSYEDNNLITIGTKSHINSKLDLNAELSSGDRGDAATVGINYQLSSDYSIYSNYTLSTDTTHNKRSTFTVGQRKSVTDQLKVYTEHQFTHENKQSGVGHTFGLDYIINKELTANASVQTARLDKADRGLTDRDAFSVGLNYKQDKTEASTRLEFRRDKGENENTEQWVTTNRINYRLSPSLRLQGKFNYSETKDKNGNTRDAKFTEAGLGFALRPVDNDRLNILGRVTYLYDLQPLSQSTKPDEKALIASIETSYQLDQKWELGGKLAHKQGQTRLSRDNGFWEKNDVSLAAARVRYHLTKEWDAMGEYHWMNSDKSQDTEQGAMISVDRHIGKNIKIGIGYNFTNFTDDLSSTDGTAKGWFINILGKY